MSGILRERESDGEEWRKVEHENNTVNRRVALVTPSHIH
jgi:hypothetical protein